jgi:8-oxo-dGTP pyrophosphatase MutT (NUDIX family)
MNEAVKTIVRGLRADEPKAPGLRLAAVSVILSDPDAPSVLLIERAESPGDPWSGQIAFPGGKMQPGDRTARGTATRETLEEVGVDLDKASEFLGYGELVNTHTGTMQVVPSVFMLRREVTVKPNGEVASYRWVKLGNLLSESTRTTHRIEFGGQTREMPASLVDGYEVWGLTHRIIHSLVGDQRGTRVPQD